jgi:putative hemolysin
MLHVTDFLKVLTIESSHINIGTIRELFTVPETLAADDLLAEMKRRGSREALVIDEYGGTAGLVTFESLIAHIVGDLGPGIGGGARTETLPDGSALIDGLVLVRDLNERFGLNIDETVYTTVGGFMLGVLGRRPRVGDTIDVDGRRMRVEALEGIRVAKVWLSRPAAEEQETEEAKRSS